MTGDEAARWISLPQGCAAAQVRLLCLPHAGSGAAGYFRWRRMLPASIAVCPVLLPGREARMAEAPMTDLQSIVEQVHQAARTLALGADGEPLAIFGHSMGSLLAYELARCLGAEGVRLAHLFVSGRDAPVASDRRLRLHGLEDEEFLEQIRLRYGLTAGGILDDPELRAVFLPILRGDLTVVETYRYVLGPALQCPLSALAGEEDHSVSDLGLSRWKACTDNDFRAGRLPGDHFYHTGLGQTALLDLIVQTLV